MAASVIVIQRRLLTISTMVLLLCASTIHCANGSSRASHGGSVDRLLERVDRYQSLLVQEEHEETYEMVAQKWRKGGSDKQEWVAYASRMGRGVKIRGWSIVSISTIGDRAKVAVSLQVETPDTAGLDSVTEVGFWQFENGDWFYIPIQLSDWNDTDATAIPLRR